MGNGTALRNIVIAACVFAGGVLAALWVNGTWSFNLSSSGALLSLMGIGFLGMGIYGLVSGRVYGRSWEKYWGGWLYREVEPKWYWQYIFMYVAVGGVLFFVACGKC